MNSYLAMSHSKAKMWPACIKQGCCWLWSLQASLPLQSWASVSFASLKVLGASSSPRPKKATPCPPGCASGERSQAVPGSSGVTAQSFLQAARRWWLAVTVLFPISGVCLRVFSLFILVWLIYSLCLPWIMFTITTRDQFCHSKILKKKKKISYTAARTSVRAVWNQTLAQIQKHWALYTTSHFLTRVKVNILEFLAERHSGLCMQREFFF